MTTDNAAPDDARPDDTGTEVGPSEDARPDRTGSEAGPSEDARPDDTGSEAGPVEAGPSEDAPSHDGLDLAPPPPPETGGSKWMPLGITAVVALMLAIAVFVWQPWARYGSTCWETDTNLIDEEARLCYTIPDGWDRMSDGDLEESVADTGFEVPSSGITGSAEGIFALAKVQSLDAYLGGSEIHGDHDPDEELQIMAEFVTVSSEAMFEGHDSIESESLTIDGFEAATATADTTDAFGTGTLDLPEVHMWVRATVVDFGGDQRSVVYSMALIPESELEAEAGIVADLNAVHDSIEVLDS